MRSRVIKTVRVYVTVSAVLLAYYFFVRASGFGVPCLIKKLTHHNCPGCGNSRAVMALAHFDVRSAVRFNAFIFAEALYAVYVCAYITYRYIKTGRYELVVRPGVLNIIFLAALLIWWVVRNILGV